MREINHKLLFSIYEYIASHFFFCPKNVFFSWIFCVIALLWTKFIYVLLHYSMLECYWATNMRHSYKIYVFFVSASINDCAVAERSVCFLYGVWLKKSCCKAMRYTRSDVVLRIWVRYIKLVIRQPYYGAVCGCEKTNDIIVSLWRMCRMCRFGLWCVNENSVACREYDFSRRLMIYYGPKCNTMQKTTFHMYLLELQSFFCHPLICIDSQIFMFVWLFLLGNLFLSTILVEFLFKSLDRGKTQMLYCLFYCLCLPLIFI